MAQSRSTVASHHILTEEALHEIVRRVVEVAQPEKIILFGSAVRGEMGPNSIGWVESVLEDEGA